MIATVGLGVTDFGYRITALIVPVVSVVLCMIRGMDSVHGFNAQAWPWRETVYYKECINTGSCAFKADIVPGGKLKIDTSRENDV